MAIIKIGNLHFVFTIQSPLFVLKREIEPELSFTHMTDQMLKVTLGSPEKKVQLLEHAQIDFEALKRTIFEGVNELNPNCKEITIDLSNVENLDNAGLSFLCSLVNNDERKVVLFANPQPLIKDKMKSFTDLKVF